MTRVIIQSAGSREPREHFEATIKNPVSLDRLRRFLTPEQISSLEAAYRDGTTSPNETPVAVTEHDARRRSGAPEHDVHVVGSRGMI